MLTVYCPRSWKKLRYSRYCDIPYFDCLSTFLPYSSEKWRVKRNKWLVSANIFYFPSPCIFSNIFWISSSSSSGICWIISSSNFSHLRTLFLTKSPLILVHPYPTFLNVSSLICHFSNDSFNLSSKNLKPMKSSFAKRWCKTEYRRHFSNDFPTKIHSQPHSTSFLFITSSFTLSFFTVDPSPLYFFEWTECSLTCSTL